MLLVLLGDLTQSPRRSSKPRGFRRVERGQKAFEFVVLEVALLEVLARALGADRRVRTLRAIAEPLSVVEDGGQKAAALIRNGRLAARPGKENGNVRRSDRRDRLLAQLLKNVFVEKLSIQLGGRRPKTLSGINHEAVGTHP